MKARGLLIARDNHMEEVFWEVDVRFAPDAGGVYKAGQSEALTRIPSRMSVDARIVPIVISVNRGHWCE